MTNIKCGPGKIYAWSDDKQAWVELAAVDYWEFTIVKPSNLGEVSGSHSDSSPRT